LAAAIHALMVIALNNGEGDETENSPQD
jgi:hypothetical protein